MLLGSRIIDAPVTRLVTGLFFPLSRLRAAAEISGRDVAAFAAAVPLARCPQGLKRHLRRVLPKIDAVRQSSEDAETAWRAAFFAPTAPPEHELLDIEKARVKAARAYGLQRFRLFWTLIRGGAPKLRSQVPSASRLGDAYGAYLDDPGAAFAVPDVLPRVDCSHEIPGRAGRDYWIRFATPSTRLGDTVWARVREPEGVAEPATLIFVGGVASEFDQIDLPPKRLLDLVRQGIRVIEVEAPFHGRRRRPGEFSGEPYFAAAPLGSIDLLTGMARELGVIANWARQRGSGPVCFGGVSMGAFVSQLAGVHAARWPAACRPDALFLGVTVDQVHRLAFESLLAHQTGLAETLKASGIDIDDAQQWRGFTDPGGPPVMPGENIIAILGRRDRITPFAYGQAQMQRWAVPPENLFVRNGGHFSTPIGMLNDGKALHRLVDLLAA